MKIKLKNHLISKFYKFMSLLVVACFVLSIANLPAYARSEKKARDNKEKNEQVIESGKTDTSEIGLVTSEEAMKMGNGESVSTMNAIGNMSEEEVDSIIEIDEETGVIKSKIKDNKVVAVYNAEKEQVLGYAGQGDIVYYQALVNRKKELERGEVNGSKKIEKLGEQKEEKETIKVEKTTKEREEREEQSGNEEVQEKSNIKGIEKEQQEGIQTNAKYNEIVSGLAQQSGLSEEKVAKELNDALAGKQKEEKEGIISLLESFLSHGGSIVNCAVEALSEVLNIASKGVLGLQALLVEISTGLFGKNNTDLINAGESQLMTSMATMQTIMVQNGQDVIGYVSGIDLFMAGLQVGNNAIVWVNEDHYITVTKLDNGNYTIADPNVRDGTKVEYSSEELKSILSGGTGTDIDGKEMDVRYNALGEDGQVRVLSASEGLKEQVEQGTARELSKEEMIEIEGARTIHHVEHHKEKHVEHHSETHSETRSETYTDEEGTHTNTWTETWTEEWDEVWYEEWYEEWDEEVSDEPEQEEQKEPEIIKEPVVETEIKEPDVIDGVKQQQEEQEQERMLAEGRERTNESITEREEENRKITSIDSITVNGKEVSKEFLDKVNKELGENGKAVGTENSADIVNEIVKNVAMKDTSLTGGNGYVIKSSFHANNPNFSFDDFKADFIDAVNNGTLEAFVVYNSDDYFMFTTQLEKDPEKCNQLIKELGIDGLEKMSESNSTAMELFSTFENNVDFDTYNSMLNEANEQDKVYLVFNCLDRNCKKIEEYCSNPDERKALIDTLGVEGIKNVFDTLEANGRKYNKVSLELELMKDQNFKATIEAEGKQDLFSHYYNGNIVKTDNGLEYSFNLTAEEEEALKFITEYMKGKDYVKEENSYFDIISMLTDYGENETIFKVLTNDNFNQTFGSDDETKYQMAVAVTEYINSYCIHYGLENPSEMSSENLNTMIELVSTAYDEYMKEVSFNVVIDENTIVLSLAGDIDRDFKAHEAFSTTGFIDLLNKIGQNKDLRTFFNYGTGQDSEKVKKDFLDAIANLTVDAPNQKIFINIQAHGNKKSFSVEDGVDITVEELADAFIQLNEKGVDLSNVCVGITSCYGYYSMTDFYNRLEDAGVDSLPAVYAEAGLETRFGYIFKLSDDDGDDDTYKEDSRFYQGLLSVVPEGETSVTLGNLYQVNNTSEESNATMFVPLDKDSFGQMNDDMFAIVSNYIDTSSLPEGNFTQDMTPRGKTVNSNTSFPVDVFAYNIFSKEQNAELNEKAAVWEEVVFRAMPSMIAAIYDKEGGKETFSAYQESFVYAHALSRWITNDENVREEMSFNELVESTRQEMGKGTEVLAVIYEEAIETAKELNSEEAREVIIDATLDAIGLHQAYNSGLISKEELESGNYDAGVIEAALQTLGVDRGVVENLIDQSLYLLGYSNKEVESEYMNMTQIYKKTDSLLQKNPEGMKIYSIQKTVSDIVMPEVVGTTGRYIAKTTDLVSSMFVTNVSSQKTETDVYAPSNENIQVQEETQKLYDYLQHNNISFSPSSPQECQLSIDFSNSPEVSEQVQQAFDLYNDAFGVEIDSNTQVIFMIGTDSNSGSACACSDINTIIVPVDNFDTVPSADYIFTKIAHEYTHILDYSKVQNGQMSMMEDEVRATENGIIADTTYGKNITMQTRYNGEQKVNFVSAMELSSFYSIMDNQDEIVEQFRQISGNQNIQFEDIYYYDVVYGENNFGIPSSSHLSSKEVGITLEYQGIKLLYVTDTGIDINGTYDNAEMGESVPHRIEKLNIVEDRYLIETTLGNYTNESFSREDVVDSFEQVVVSKAFLNSFGKEFGIDIDNLQYAYYDFPTDSSFSDSGDVIRFYVVDKETDNMYSVDVKKDMGIVQVCDVTNDEILWEAREGLSKSLEPKTSTATTTSPKQTQSMKMSVSISMGEEIVSDYEYIHDLSITDLQQTVNDSNADVTVRYLAFLELKEKGENVVIPDDMKDAAKEYLASVMNGEASLITAEEKKYGQYETATDRLKASLAMVYDIMLDSYIEEFNIDDDTINQIWSNIYNNTEIYTSQPGFANSNFSFQVEAMLPDIMAHEIMHNITDVYLGTDKNETKKGIGEFSSDVARIILCEQIGVELTQDLKDEYKEEAGYMKVGMTPIEEHHLARGVLGLLIETSVKLEMSIDWDTMMSAVAQCLQSDSFMGTVEEKDYSQTIASLLSRYVSISTGNPSAVIVSTRNETEEICQNIMKFFNFAQF